MMVSQGLKYCYEDAAYRKILYSPLKKSGFVPEKESEIFVSGIPETATVYDLAKFFEQVGELFQAKLMVRVDDNRNRGFGFITFMNKNKAHQALKELKNKPFIAGNCLYMQKSVDNCRIFVGGVPIRKTKDEIWQEIKNSYNVTNIVDVITYRNYSNPMYNRGFVFLEFRTHEEASYFRAKYADKMSIFGKQLLIDWSVPIMETDENILAQVKILFLRNLDVTQTSEDFARLVYQLVERWYIEKVYKFKDYAYVHIVSRENAERLLEKMKRFYEGTTVEISFAKPPNKFTDRTFRDKALVSRRATAPRPWLNDGSESIPSPSMPQIPSASSYGSPSSLENSEIMSQMSHNTLQCLAAENTLKHLISQRYALQNRLTPTSSDYGNSSNSSGYSSFSCSPRSGSLRPDLTPRNVPVAPVRPDLLPVPGSSYLPPFQIPPVRAITRVGLGHPMQTSAPTFPQGDVDFEDMVNSLLMDS